jgi:hypothetical protein
MAYPNSSKCSTAGHSACYLPIEAPPLNPQITSIYSRPRSAITILHADLPQANLAYPWSVDPKSRPMRRNSNPAVHRPRPARPMHSRHRARLNLYTSMTTVSSVNRLCARAWRSCERPVNGLLFEQLPRRYVGRCGLTGLTGFAALIASGAASPFVGTTLDRVG